MEVKVINSRTSVRLAEKRRHFGRLDCPCCVKKTRTSRPKSIACEKLQDGTLSEQNGEKVSNNSGVVVKRKRGRPPKQKTDNGSISQTNSTEPAIQQGMSDSGTGERAQGHAAAFATCCSKRNAGNVTATRSTDLHAISNIEMIQTVLKDLPCSRGNTSEVFDTVSAVLNVEHMNQLQQRNRSWDKELAAVCQVQIALSGEPKILIAHNIDDLIVARDTLTQMLKADKEKPGKCLINESESCPGHNINDVAMKMLENKHHTDIQKMSLPDDCKRMNSVQHEEEGKSHLQIRMATDNSRSTDSEIDNDSMDKRNHGQPKIQEMSTDRESVSNLIGLRASCNDVIEDKGDSPKDNKNEMLLRNLKTNGKVKEEHEIDDCDPVKEQSSGNDGMENCHQGTGKNDVIKDNGMSREEVLQLIDELEAGLIMEEANPSEIWKVLTKRYTRSERTNKKQVVEDELTMCDLCGQYQGTEAAILSHKRRCHPKVIYRCDLCRRAFGVKYACLMHRVGHLGRGRRNQVSQLLRIERQKEKGNVKHINLDRMMENITRAGNSTLLKNPERATHKCKYCNYRGTRIGVTSHTLRYHPKRVYKCDECSKTYGTRYLLDIHKESHAMKRLREAKKKQACHLVPQPKQDGSPICLPDEYKHIHKCDICGFMTTKSALSQHKHRHHQEKLFQCDLCNKWFSRRCEFNSHRTSHFDKDGNLRNIRKVENSSEETSQKIQVINSLNGKDKLGHGETDGQDLAIQEVQDKSSINGSYDGTNRTSLADRAGDSKLCSCEICGFETTSDGLLMHKRRQHKDARFECDICCKRFRINSILQKHRLTHFTESGELKPWLRRKCGLEEENLKCHECSVVFKSSRAMEIHVAKKHKKLKRYMCEFCLYRGFTKNDVDVHVARMHKSRDHKCDQCGKVYAFEKELERHLAVMHQGTEQCKCHICGQEFKMIRYLKNHLERHKGKFRCYCSVCGKGFMDNCRLKEHEQTHKPTAERDHRYHCDICSKGFLRRSTWQQHMDCHYKNRCHTCDLCGKAFTLPQTLWKHKLRHKSERPYPCNYPGCTKAFFDKTTYQYHYVTHTGQSDHKCNTCGKVFTQAATLRRHVCKMALRHFQDEIGDAEAAKSISELQAICPNSENLVSVIRSSELSSSSDQAIVIQPEGLALLDQLDSQERVLQVVDNPGAAHNIMIILGETKQDQDVIQQTHAQQEGTAMDEAADLQLIELPTVTPQETYPVTSSMTLDSVPLQQQVKLAKSGLAEVESQQYLCSICERLFATWEEIKMHMVQHTGDDSQMTLSVVDPRENMTTEEIYDS